MTKNKHTSKKKNVLKNIMKTVNIIVIDCYMTIVDELFWLAGKVIDLLRMVAI